MKARRPADQALLLRLHAEDTVGCLPKSLPADATVRHEGQTWQLSKTLGLGHKIALTDIREGEKVIKFGVPIGSAIMDIAAGEHVHLHNLSSDYLPTYTLEEGGRFGD
jgi:altronate dehydratase small subunit